MFAYAKPEQKPKTNVTTKKKVLPHKGIKPETKGEFAGEAVIQMKCLKNDRLNMVGESHPDGDEVESVRSSERRFCAEEGLNNYWTESQFVIRTPGKTMLYGDSPYLRFKHCLVKVHKNYLTTRNTLEAMSRIQMNEANEHRFVRIHEDFKINCRITVPICIGNMIVIIDEIKRMGSQAFLMEECLIRLEPFCLQVQSAMRSWLYEGGAIEGYLDACEQLFMNTGDIYERIANPEKLDEKDTKVKKARSNNMHYVANEGHTNIGVWKVGESHVKDIRGAFEEEEIQYNLVAKDVFNSEHQKWKKKQQSSCTIL